MKLQIKVIPSSSKDCIAGWLENTLKVKVKAPPDKGKANKAVIKVLKNQLGLATNSIDIISGSKPSKKIVNITCDNEETLSKKLANIC